MNSALKNSLNMHCLDAKLCAIRSYLYIIPFLIYELQKVERFK